MLWLTKNFSFGSPENWFLAVHQNHRIYSVHNSTVWSHEATGCCFHFASDVVAMSLLILLLFPWMTTIDVVSPFDITIVSILLLIKWWPHSFINKKQFSHQRQQISTLVVMVNEVVMCCSKKTSNQTFFFCFFILNSRVRNSLQQLNYNDSSTE